MTGQETRNKLTASSRRRKEATQPLQSIYEQELAGLDALKKSLLHEAFSGNL